MLRSSGNDTSSCATIDLSSRSKDLSATQIAVAFTTFHNKSPPMNGSSAKGANSSANVGEYLK